MKNQTTWIIIIIAIAILVLPSAFLGVMGSFGDLLDSLFKGFGGFGNQQAQLGWEIGYADGTKEEITPNSSMPLTVLYQEKEVDYVGSAIWIKLTYSKEPSSIVGTFQLNLYIDNEPWDVSDPHYPTNTQINQEPPESGVWTKVQGGGLSGSVREVEKRDNGQLKSHTIKGIATIELTVYMVDGTSKDLEGTAEGTLTVNVIETATLDVQVRPNVASIYPTNLR